MLLVTPAVVVAVVAVVVVVVAVVTDDQLMTQSCWEVVQRIGSNDIREHDDVRCSIEADDDDG